MQSRAAQHDVRAAVPFVIVPEQSLYGLRFPVYDRTTMPVLDVVDRAPDRALHHSLLVDGDGIMVSFLVLSKRDVGDPGTMFLALNVVRVFGAGDQV